MDAKLATDFDVEDEAVPLDRVLQAMEPAKRLRLVLLDACRENPFATTMKVARAGRSVGRGLGRIEASGGNTLIAYATNPNAIAEDGSGVNSPFTAALVKHLTTPGLDVRLALGAVHDEVLATTAGRQEPYVTGAVGGGILALVPGASGVHQPTTAAGDAAETARICREAGAISSLATLAVLERHHKGRPAGECIAARIEELKKQAVTVTRPEAPTPSLPKQAPANCFWFGAQRYCE